MQISLEDIEFTKKALYGFVCRSAPNSSEEKNNLKILRCHPFFRLWGTRAMDYKTKEYYAGELYSPLGKFCTPDVFVQLQDTFQDALVTLKDSSKDFISSKLESVARVKEISNLRLEAISEIMGRGEMSIFIRSREAYINEIYPRQLTIVMTYECNLNCRYCFSKGLSLTEPGYLDNDVFERIIEWMDGKEFKHVSLFGGEPTLHPDFINYIIRLNNLGYRVYFATNGLYSEKVAEGLNETDSLKATFNIPASGTYTARQESLLKRNLSCFPSHIRKFFRFTLSEENRDLKLLEELTEEFNPDSISFALAFPSGDYSNDFIDKDKISLFTQDIFKLIELANEKKLYSGLVKPFPLCKFTEGELMTMLGGIDLFNTCDIYHDNFMQLTTVSHKGVFYPCIALRHYGKIHLDDNPTLDDISKYNRSVVERLSENPVIEECSSCNLYKSHLCQGFCYSYFSDSR
ncbi:MAG: radical SAM protein [Deltaproteobacteria bacterium]|nr:radical SAM protein [Deltaproteobacteria bacterium]